MKIPFTNIQLGRDATRTGAVMRSVTVGPGEANMIREMTNLSAQLMRDVSHLNGKMVRNYDAAITDNFTQDFKGTYGNANSEQNTTAYTIRARVRTVAKDYPHGKAIVRTVAHNVVGHNPFRLTMRTGKKVSKPHETEPGQTVQVFEPDEAINSAIENEWKKFCRSKNFTIRQTISAMEALMQMESSAVTVGGCLVRKWRGYPGNKYGFAVDVLEIDRLQETFHGKAPGTGNPIRASIEYHPVWNYPVAYWILTRHPGEFVAVNYPGQYANSSGGNIFRERVPAEDIIHYNNLRDRPEQDRGFTELDSIIRKLHENFQYAKALTLASIASCCKPFIIEKDTPTGITLNPTSEEFAALLQNSGKDSGDSAAAKQQGILPNQSAMSPAMTQVLDWGFKMKVLDPKFPIEAAHEFKVDNLKEIATAAGVAYSSLTGDFQSLGYIAAQMSMTPERNHCMVRQAHMKDVVILDIFQEWLRSAIMSPVFESAYGFSLEIGKLEQYVDASSFKAKRWPFTDALREIQALVLKVQNRLISPQQAQDEMPDGIDYEDVVAQIAEAKECEEAHGLAPIGMSADQPADTTEEPDGEDGGEGAQAPAKKNGSSGRGLLFRAPELNGNGNGRH